MGENKRGRQIVVLDNAEGSRSVRQRTDDFAYKFLIYLPNKTSVEVRLDLPTCRNISVPEFIERVRVQSTSKDDDTKQKQRVINWKNKGNFYITDFQGDRVLDEKGVFLSLADDFKAGRGLLLHDKHPETVHFHPDFWNVTPETHLLGILPQDYSVFSALADELDNSLQAVYQLPAAKRLIRVDLDHVNQKITIYDTGKGMDSSPGNSISKWGTMGSSMYRRQVKDAIGIAPPYLKPNFGMFGLGGIGAGFHLGGCITVSSKTKMSERVVVLHLAQETLRSTTKAGNPWKTGGEFRPPTDQELQWSPHGSFTKVEITNLNPEIKRWRVEEVQRKLKDFYFPYIQNDDGDGGLTTRPVEIRVNDEDLAGVLGGEVAHANYSSSNGVPFVLLLHFSRTVASGGGAEQANARITCRYFPIQKGREAIDDILDSLKQEDPLFVEPGVLGEVNFDNYSRRSIRRLGRLLPRARGGRLPFMEWKKMDKENEVNRHCFKRAKAFIDVDAGFVPTHSKTDLDPNSAFTEALLKLGSGQQIVDGRGVVTVSMNHDGVFIKPEQLHSKYKAWIIQNHRFDTDAVVQESSAVIIAQPHHKEELNIKSDGEKPCTSRENPFLQPITAPFFRVVYNIKVKNKDWKVGKKEAPVRLKLQKGLPGLNNNDIALYTTVECFIVEGLGDEPGENQGETKIICRSMGIPEDHGSREMVDESHEHTFVLGESRVFPIEILYGDKWEEVDEAVWQKQEESKQSRSPAFVDLLTVDGGLSEHISLKAGEALPTDIIAVVRPKIWRDHMTAKGAGSSRSLQKYIIAEPMEMTLVVKKREYLSPEVSVNKNIFSKRSMDRSMATAQKIYSITVKATTEVTKGLYRFSTTGNELERITQSTGTYFFEFSLASAKYPNVENLIMRINVAPSSKIGKWTLCSHPGLCSEHHPNGYPELLKVRIGEELPCKLYLSRVDEFGNPKKFEECPLDIDSGIFTMDDRQIKLASNMTNVMPTDDKLHLEIQTIRLGLGYLKLLRPTMQATLRMIVDGVSVANFPISVSPGRMAVAKVKECDAPKGGLHPGQILEKFIVEVFDNHENPVLGGEQVKVALDGFEFQDKAGHTRPVDGNGCLDLAMRLRVAADYGGKACLEIQTTEDSSPVLMKKTFKVVDRSLRTRNVPERAVFGSQLMGIEVEAVDEHGQVDQTMDGASHTLKLDWSANMFVPFHKGVCRLPSIPMCKVGIWKGSVLHSQHQKLKTSMTVIVEKPLVKSERGLMSPALENHSGNYDGLVEDDSVVQGLETPSQVFEDGSKEALELAIRSTVDEGKKLTQKLHRLGLKLEKYEEERDGLKAEKEQHEETMKQFQSQIDALKVLSPESGARSSVPSRSSPFVGRRADVNITPTDGQIQLYHESTREVELQLARLSNPPGYSTPREVESQIAKLGEPPGTHAAAILLQSQGQLQAPSDIIGIVALLGAVEDEAVNRALVQFLGSEKMLAIISTSNTAADCYGIFHNDGSLEPSQGIHGLAQRLNLEISSRFQVITLADESSFYRRTDGRPSVMINDPQKRLNFGDTFIPGSNRPTGSLGYAVNLIHLNEDQLKIRVFKFFGLRESLFFVLFGYLEVFDTTVNMLKAQKEQSITSPAVALDGGIIRAKNEFEFGGREEPQVWFPTWVNTPAEHSTPPRRSVSFREVRPLRYKQLKELGKEMDLHNQRYLDKGVEQRLQKVTEQILKTISKIDAVNEDVVVNTQKGTEMSSIVHALHNTPRRLAFTPKR